MVAATGVIIHGTKASSATVQIFDYNRNIVDRMSYSWTQELPSISIPEGEGESQNMILVALSLVLLWESNGRTCLLLDLLCSIYCDTGVTPCEKIPIREMGRGARN
jgi:hypothetical protein